MLTLFPPKKDIIQLGRHVSARKGLRDRCGKVPTSYSRDDTMVLGLFIGERTRALNA
jgi:hypothetical protein